VLYLDRPDGVRLAYEVSGADAGPTVVMTHGVSMDHRLWEPQVAALADRYRVVTYDMRGHGDSPCAPEQFSTEAAADDLVALMDAVVAERAAFVGHSLGATVSQLAALEQPQRPLAFVGLGCACITLPPSLAMRGFSAIAGPVARHMGPTKMREDTAKRAGVLPETQAYAMDAMSRLDDAMFERAVSVGFGDYCARDGYRIGVPLLLLQGDKDGYKPLLSSAKRWAKRDGGEYVTVPDAAHNAGQDNAPFVNERISAFLDGALAEWDG
jgi:3-oxoadipate enol-lactonase